MIRNEILKECPGGHDVGERLGAIKNAVSDLKPGDILLIAGKGHEQGQVIGNNVINFDDVSVVCSTILALEKDEIENKKGLS
jgi:UDP-N-acetylmuramoyl-L-alanyl-D-glutamate--2,6-diaminopimelate ligase